MDSNGSKEERPLRMDRVQRRGCVILLVAALVCLGILVGGSFLATHGPPHPITRTVSMMHGLTMALEYYSVEYDGCPPDRAVGIHADLDKPTECLVYYLSGATITSGPQAKTTDPKWPHPVFAAEGRSGMEIFYQFWEACLRDMDNDGIPEVVDGWGTPFLYNSGTGRDGPFNQGGAPIHNPGRFDLSSAGPDRLHGTRDDIGNWKD